MKKGIKISVGQAVFDHNVQNIVFKILVTDCKYYFSKKVDNFDIVHKTC